MLTVPLDGIDAAGASEPSLEVGVLEREPLLKITVSD
jgi:hypothetical protein